MGPSNMLYVGVHAGPFQPGHFTGWGSEGVNVLGCQADILGT